MKRPVVPIGDKVVPIGDKVVMFRDTSIALFPLYVIYGAALWWLDRYRIDPRFFVTFSLLGASILAIVGGVIILRKFNKRRDEILSNNTGE